MSRKYRFQCKCPKPDTDFDKELTEADVRTCVIESDECNEY